MQSEYAYLKVYVQPRASRNEIIGWRGESLHVRLTALPVEGAANKGCQDFLAKALGFKRAAVELFSGNKSREKHFRIAGLSTQALNKRIDSILSK